MGKEFGESFGGSGKTSFDHNRSGSQYMRGRPEKEVEGDKDCRGGK